MKAIILCAWEGSRLRPLTTNTPKPWIKVFWKPIVGHILENISPYVDEAIIVIKYKWERLKELLWNEYAWVKISYYEQWDKKWTWWALDWLKFDDDLLFLYWDSIIDKRDIEKVINNPYEAILTEETKTPEKYWIFKENDWFAEAIIEKPQEYVWNLANLWVFKLKKDFFNEIPKIEKSPRWEYEITCAINSYLKKNKIALEKANREVVDITYPWDILKANEKFLNDLNKISSEWEIEEWVTIKWSLIVWKWAIIKSWTYIEWNAIIWDWAVIWPNAYLKKWVVIWNNSKIWNAVEISASQVWDNTSIAHLSYVWNSVLGDNINIGWGFITWNLRHDKKTIRAMSKWELVDTWLIKLWIIMWDWCKTWINTSSYPGRTLDANSTTLPGEIIK